MGDLISRSALLEIFSDKNSKQCEFWHYGIIQAHIKTAPAVEAVPVVRCWECVHYDHGFCWRFDTEDNYPNDYCSYGVSKDTKAEET